MIRILVSVVVALFVITGSNAYSDGAIPHPEVCNNLLPNHGIQPVDATGSFHLAGKRVGSNIKVDIISDDGQLTFKGFVVRFSPQGAGKFVGGNTFACESPDDAVTHAKNNGKTIQAVTFVPNAGFENAPIKFLATVVHSYDQIYKGLTTTVN